MTKTTDIRNMDAPAVGSGKDAKETCLKGTGSAPKGQNATNTLSEYTTPAQPKGKLGGRRR